MIPRGIERRSITAEELAREIALQTEESGGGGLSADKLAKLIKSYERHNTAHGVVAEREQFIVEGAQFSRSMPLSPDFQEAVTLFTKAIENMDRLGLEVTDILLPNRLQHHGSAQQANPVGQ